MCKKEKIQIFNSKFIKLVKTHRAISSLVIIAFALLLIFIPQLFIKLPLIGESHISGIELIMFSSQIVSAIFVIIGTVIAVWQYYLSSSKRIKELEFARVEKAIELSNYYKDNILNRYSVLKIVFDDYGITKMMEEKRKEIEIKDFDVGELNKNFTQAEIDKFAKLRQDKKFINSIIQVALACNIDVKGLNICNQLIKNGEEEKISISVNYDKVYNDFFKTYIMQTLNNTEYFAMAFTHKTADESVIYQSIYPTYLEMCFVLYYYIAKESDPKVAKLYTNLASLYCIWRKKANQQKEEINKKTRDIGTDMGSIVN